MGKQTTQRRRVNQKNKPTIKRLLANKCERERVRRINEAFEILKTHIPYCDSGRIQTKLDVLKFAIDYIQILTKMVTQSEAEMVLGTPRIDSMCGFLSSGGASETESPRSPSEMFPARPQRESAFQLDDIQSPLGMTSPTSSNDEVFFGVNENISGHSWSDHQSGFHQQHHHHTELPSQHNLLQAHKIPSFDEQEQGLLSFWSYQGTDIPKAIMPLETSTQPPSDINDEELTNWLNLLT